MKTVSELDTRELLALAISSEEEDSRVYLDFSEGLRSNYPDSAKIFSDMAREENEHRRRLISLFVERFGDHIPMNPAPGHPRWIRRPPHWQVRALGIDAVRARARQMEEESAKFYLMAAAQTSDAAARKLLGDLAETEMFHENKAAEIEARHLTRLSQLKRRAARKLSNISGRLWKVSTTLAVAGCGRFGSAR